VSLVAIAVAGRPAGSGPYVACPQISATEQPNLRGAGGHFLAIRVRPANRDIPRAAGGSLPECWLPAG
jgi:hypothetical protein